MSAFLRALVFGASRKLNLLVFISTALAGDRDWPLLLSRSIFGEADRRQDLGTASLELGRKFPCQFVQKELRAGLLEVLLRERHATLEACVDHCRRAREYLRTLRESLVDAHASLGIKGRDLVVGLHGFAHEQLFVRLRGHHLGAGGGHARRQHEAALTGSLVLQLLLTVELSCALTEVSGFNHGGFLIALVHCLDQVGVQVLDLLLQRRLTLDPAMR